MKPIKTIKRVLSIISDEGICKLFYIFKNRLFSKYQAWNIYHRQLARTSTVPDRKEFPLQPLISIVTPVYQTEANVLRSLLESVIGQTYQNWELCIVNASPDRLEIDETLRVFQKMNSKIKIETIVNNLGIAGNTNRAIQIATGKYIAFLDHDDTLAPFALSELIKAINQHPMSEVFYSDEDKITYSGKNNYDPFFKPAFSIDYLRFINYLCHFLVIKRDLGARVGWLREGYEGAQDYDLILRCVELAKEVTHIPLVLYHWRASRNSTASDIVNKSYAIGAGLRALSEHLRRMQYDWQITPGKFPTSHKYKSSMTSNEKITIIIPNHNHLDDLRNCITSVLERTTYKNYQLLIVENNSTEKALFDYYKSIERLPNIEIVEFNQSPFNYSDINNYAVAQSDTELILLLNNDTQIITPDWLQRMVEHIVRPEVAGVGAKLFYGNKRIQHGGVILGIGGVAGHSHKKFKSIAEGYFHRLEAVQNLSVVTAACFLTKKSIYQTVSGLEPALALAFNDVDLCMKMRKLGYLIVWTPDAQLLHLESKTRGYEDTEEKKKRFRSEIEFFTKRWKQELALGDPYYNPWLTLDREDFSLASRPGNLQARALPGLQGLNH